MVILFALPSYVCIAAIVAVVVIPGILLYRAGFHEEIILVGGILLSLILHSLLWVREAPPAGKRVSPADTLLDSDLRLRLTKELDETWRLARRADWRRLHSEALRWRDASGEPVLPEERSAATKWARAHWAAHCILRYRYVVAAIGAFILVKGLASWRSPVDSVTEVEESIPALIEEARNNPESASAQRKLGWALVRHGRRTEAIQALYDAVRLDPQDVDTHVLLGAALNDELRYEEAVPVLEEALRLDPTNGRIHRYLGWSLLNLDRLEEAEVSYREALKWSPKLADAHTELAFVLIELRRLDEAEAACREAIRLEPSRPRHHRGLAIALMQNGKLREALASYMEAVKFDPDSPLLWAEIGRLHHFMGEHEQAVAAFEKAHELDPDFFQKRKSYRRIWNAAREGRQYQADDV